MNGAHTHTHTLTNAADVQSKGALQVNSNPTWCRLIKKQMWCIHYRKMPAKLCDYMIFRHFAKSICRNKTKQNWKKKDRAQTNFGHLLFHFFAQRFGSIDFFSIIPLKINIINGLTLCDEPKTIEKASESNKKQGQYSLKICEGRVCFRFIAHCWLLR